MKESRFFARIFSIATKFPNLKKVNVSSQSDLDSAYKNPQQWKKLLSEKDLLPICQLDETSNNVDDHLTKVIDIIDNHLVPNCTQAFNDILKNPVFEDETDTLKSELIEFGMLAAFKLGFNLGERRGQLEISQGFFKDNPLLDKKHNETELIEHFSSMLGRRKNFEQREKCLAYLRSLFVSEPGLSKYKKAQKLNQTSKLKQNGFTREIPLSTSRSYVQIIEKEKEKEKEKDQMINKGTLHLFT